MPANGADFAATQAYLASLWSTDGPEYVEDFVRTMKYDDLVTLAMCNIARQSGEFSSTF